MTFWFRQELLTVQAACNVSVQCYQSLVFRNAWETWEQIKVSCEAPDLCGLTWVLPGYQCFFWRGRKLCSRGSCDHCLKWLTGWATVQGPFRHFLKVKAHSRDGHNLHNELNSALKIKCCSVITWNLQIIVLPSSWIYRLCCADNESMHTHLGCQECFLY